MSVVGSFRALHFDVTKMPLTSRIENQEAISFAYRSGKKRTRIVIIFCYRLFLSLWSEILMTFASVRKVHEKSCGLSGFTTMFFVVFCFLFVFVLFCF